MGSQDKREHKGQLTPGDSEMELRDPENHEDGDTEVRDGTQGRKKARERDNAEIESEMETKRGRKQMQRDRKKH